MAPEPDTSPFPMAAKPSLPPARSKISDTGRYLQMFFLAAAILMAAFHVRSDVFITFSVIFSAIVLEAFPFMLIGTLLGGFVEVFLSRDQLLRILPKEKKQAVAVAAFMGIIFPVCECAIVPVVRKFIQKGMPLGSAVAFLLGGPIVNPLVFSSTLVAYSFAWDVAFLRVFIGVVIAMSIGLLTDACLSKKQALLPFSEQTGCACGHAGCTHTHGIDPHRSLGKKIMAALSHGAVDFYDIGRFLIIGAFIAAALQTLVPRQAFMAIAQGPFAAITAMMALAVALNLCSEADAFIAASFQPMGMPLSAQMAFMVLGPMLDIKLILMYLAVFTRRMIFFLAFQVCLSVFLAMAFLEMAQWL
ncbi:MAG TPA: permease [Desulfotignum sp.]|nr:permease [Desulfotignum sp.]